jgi:hypothetical protein
MILASVSKFQIQEPEINQILFLDNLVLKI